MPDARPSLFLQPGGDRRLRRGHPWVYSNEIRMDAAAKALPAGSLVTLAETNGRPLGTAYFNPHTLIAARLLSRDAEAIIDEDFLAARLDRALALRERFYPGGHYRLVHAEADGLPGLVIDRFGEAAVVQVNTAGMERLGPMLLGALERTIRPKTILIKSDTPARTLEGLTESLSWRGARPAGPWRVEENGFAYLAEPEGGQKTGWFFDQRENRARLAAMAAGGRVLDLYAYTGGFGLLAAARGADQVTLIDRSQAALALARQTADLHGLGARLRFCREEAFPALDRLETEDQRFDIVIADPPAFVKAKKDLKPGAKGYRRLSAGAAGRVAPGGLLFIASCSHHMPRDLFLEEVARGMGEAGRAARLLGIFGAAADHPVHPLLPESDYLKAALYALD